MAERLTEVGMFIDTPVYKIKNGKKGEAVDKLAKLEDVLEKYGIESLEELNQMLEWLFTLSGQDADDMKFITRDRKLIHQQYCDIKTDRYTWKRACELACKWFKQTGFIGDQIKVDYFYQQAKKEGE